jgi:hypothetical protein
VCGEDEGYYSLIVPYKPLNFGPVYKYELTRWAKLLNHHHDGSGAEIQGFRVLLFDLIIGFF